MMMCVFEILRSYDGEIGTRAGYYSSTNIIMKNRLTEGRR